MFLVDTDKENIQKLSGLLKKEHGVVPGIWKDSRGYHAFLDKSEGGIVFIRIDNCAIQGLNLTQAAISGGAGAHVVWMSESKAHALHAFQYGVEAYMLLPATGEALWDAINSLKIKSGLKSIHAEGADKNED